MPVFNRDRLAEATLNHPLVSGPLFRGETVIFNASTPVPPLSEIPAGFDAIFQFTAPLLSDRLQRLLGGTAFTVISYDTSNLSSATQQEILGRVQAALQSTTQSSPQTSSSDGITVVVSGGGTSPGAGSAAQLTELPNPLALRVTVWYPEIKFAEFEPRPFDADVEWTIAVDVGVPDLTSPAGSVSVGGSFSGFDSNLEFGLGSDSNTSAVGTPGSSGSPSPQEGVNLRFIPLTRGIAETRANVRVGTQAASYQTWARLDFSGTGVDIRQSGDSLFADLLGDEVNMSLSNGIQHSLGVIFAHPELNITPRMALGGVLQPNEQLAGVHNFRVNHRTGLGNRPSQPVLSLCVNVGSANAVGDLSLVRPFVDDRNFSCYVSETIVRDVLQVRLARLRPAQLEFSASVPIDMELSDNPGVIVTGRGTIRFRIVNVADILFDVTTVDLPDAIRLSGAAEITLLEAYNHRSQRIQNLDNYGNPVIESFAHRIYPFGGVPPLPPGPAQQFFDTVVALILEPLDRPTAEPVNIRDAEGGLSSPLHAYFMRGRMST